MTEAQQAYAALTKLHPALGAMFNRLAVVEQVLHGMHEDDPGLVARGAALEQAAAQDPALGAISEKHLPHCTLMWREDGRAYANVDQRGSRWDAWVWLLDGQHFTDCEAAVGVSREDAEAAACARLLEVKDADA